jgi:hypothetical protein
MKKQSTSSLIGTLITFIGAFICLPFETEAKPGDQNNWYLAEETPIDISNIYSSVIKFWKDPRDSEYKILHAPSQGAGTMAPGDIYNSPSDGGGALLKIVSNTTEDITFDQIEGYDGTYDFDSSTVKTFESPLSIDGITDFVVLPDSTILMIADVKYDWQLENPYPFRSLVHASIVDKKAKVLLGDTNQASWSSLCYGGNDKLVLSNRTLLSRMMAADASSSIPYFQVFQVTRNSINDISINSLQDFNIQTGTAPGQIKEIKDLEITFDDRLAVLSGDEYGNSGYINFFSMEGKFIDRSQLVVNFLEVAQKGYFISQHAIYNHFGEIIVDGINTVIEKQSWDGLNVSSSGIAMTPEGHLLSLAGKYVGAAGSPSFFFQKWNRAYRTKGLQVPNKIPQPLVHLVKQRPGTNILDIDFEIIDTDDATATAGLIAAVNGEFEDLSKLIIPTSWAEGTESKIGQPIATNEIHRVSWYVKGDWNELSGDLKIGVLCGDARRTKPVDLHFLKLPFEEGSLTISRYPIFDQDVSKYLLFELATGSSNLSLSDGKIKDAEGEILAETGTLGEPGSTGSMVGVVGILSTPAGRDFFMNALGYSWATSAELTLAKEAATPGSINQFTQTNPILPGYNYRAHAVNEYGFNTGYEDGGLSVPDSIGSFTQTGEFRTWWVVKESTLSQSTQNQ